MIVEQIKEYLETQYRLEHWIDLADYDNFPTSKLYARIQECKKDSIDNNERIVFVADKSLKRTFADLPCDILDSLQRHIQYFDIPHFFVIIVSNIESITDDLEHLRANYNPQESIAIPHITYV